MRRAVSPLMAILIFVVMAVAAGVAIEAQLSSFPDAASPGALTIDALGVEGCRVSVSVRSLGGSGTELSGNSSLLITTPDGRLVTAGKLFRAGSRLNPAKAVVQAGEAETLEYLLAAGLPAGFYTAKLLGAHGSSATGSLEVGVETASAYHAVNLTTSSVNPHLLGTSTHLTVSGGRQPRCPAAQKGSRCWSRSALSQRTQ